MTAGDVTDDFGGMTLGGVFGTAIAVSGCGCTAFFVSGRFGGGATSSTRCAPTGFIPPVLTPADPRLTVISLGGSCRLTSQSLGTRKSPMTPIAWMASDHAIIRAGPSAPGRRSDSVVVMASVPPAVASAC